MNRFRRGRTRLLLANAAAFGVLARRRSPGPIVRIHGPDGVLWRPSPAGDRRPFAPRSENRGVPPNLLDLGWAKGLGTYRSVGPTQHFQKSVSRARICFFPMPSCGVFPDGFGTTPGKAPSISCDLECGSGNGFATGTGNIVDVPTASRLRQAARERGSEYD